MRADRLLSLLMLLQNRGCMTARELADELEVSERTIHRDTLALSAAGVPLYTKRGPGGGICLLDSYRTNLTGLNRNEVRALFMLSIPDPLAELGLSQELKGALLKLSAALPAGMRHDEETVRQRVYLDSAWWYEPREAIPHLQTIQQGVWQDRKARLTLHWEYVDVRVEREISPLGLVSKGGVWHVVWIRAGQFGVYKLSQITDAHLLDETFQRSDDFDLVSYWKDWCLTRASNRPLFPVTARVSPELLPHLPRFFGDRIGNAVETAGPSDEDGWLTLTLPYDYLETARTQLLGFGRAVEVLEPLALRLNIHDYARQIVEVYNDSMNMRKEKSIT